MIEWFIVPCISGIIGWLTNYIAIKLLFWPEQPKQILGYTIQGIFIKKQEDIAAKLKVIVNEKILTPERLHDLLQNKIDNVDIEETIRREVSPIIKTFSTSGSLIKKLYLSDKKQNQFIEQITNLLKERVSEWIAGDMLLKNITSLELGNEAEKAVIEMQPKEVKALLKDVIQSELRFIEIIGAIMGAIIGLIQVGILKTIGSFL